ncbi:primosomal protein N' [Mangrovimicrobium sediminis]|uniref:Replication restart protein PriA n=1 Tax=Mangrovimicrobium sediminis TaxID=2562682 RepID=A0A4Z0M184_9GAMM|nr:primosomal protein N' [Haliea sp. SAOS-164]TGD73055.1 primosomal protein N' [Haliea sp. SAOS-164]
MSVLRVAVPTPLHSLFDYLPPEGVDAAALRPGCRLRVPFGAREVTACLVEVVADSDLADGQLKRAGAAIDLQPLLPDTLLELCRWAADYYQHPPGEVYQAAFPVALRQGRGHAPLALPGWRLSTRGRGLPAGALARSPKQSKALACLQGADTVAADVFAEQGISRSILRALEDKGLAERCDIPLVSSGFSAASHPPLTAEQQAVVADLREAPREFACHLVEGVTGSGKTEIYLQLIEDCVAAGRQALVLIPEIGLTPQTLSRFQRRFDAEFAVLHSGLGEAQRARAWEAARSGLAQIVIGTRSAVFTPLARPGLIVVDEEHDASYKQQDGFRYHARDVAVKRAQIENCPILLGSATPCLETLNNALAGRYRHHRLTRRAGGGQPPRIEAIDVRHATLEAGLSNTLLQAVEETLGRNEQVLLFLNRRGFAPTVQCHDCGWTATCSACDARLTLHRRARRLRCHHCGAARPLPRECPDCRSQQLLTRGLGTEQSEEVLRQRFPAWPVFRVDSDSMQGRQAMQALVDQVNRGDPCILLGTQMLTKGHHFPGLTLVGIVDMDAMLFSTDFRGEEHAAQLLTQVAGRAGREATPGRVLLQTHHPQHPALQAMLAQPYHEQARAMLARREATGLPPYGYLLLARSDCRDADAGEEFLRQLRSAAQGRLGGTQVIGPLPAPMQRRAGLFRSQLLLHCTSRAAARRAAHTLVEVAASIPARGGLKWSLDVDPQDLY